MSPEGAALAGQRVKLELVEDRKRFARQRLQVTSEHNKHGMLHSSSHVLAIYELCEREFLTRAKAAWVLTALVIDSEGWTPSENNQAQVRAIIEHALTEGSTDVGEAYGQVRSLMHSGRKDWQPDLEVAMRHALDTVMTDVDIDNLRRKARRLPLVDELSAPRYRPVREHWGKAAGLADQLPPDTVNALKEVASAVESLAQIVLRKTGITLGEATKELRSRKRLPVGADGILDGLYAFANSTPGARHGSAVAAHIDPSHWEFARTTAEGAIRLLLALDSVG